MMAVPGAGDLVTTFSYHRYDETDSALPQIRASRAQIWQRDAMPEHLTGDAKELYADLTEADVSAWQQWGIASTEDKTLATTEACYYFVDIKDPDQPNIRMGRRTAALPQYFKFIRMGATRIGARSDRSRSNAVVFRNTNGTYVVVVNADRAGPVSVHGLPPEPMARAIPVGMGPLAIWP